MSTTGSVSWIWQKGLVLDPSAFLLAVKFQSNNLTQKHFIQQITSMNLDNCDGGQQKIQRGLSNIYRQTCKIIVMLQVSQ